MRSACILPAAGLAAIPAAHASAPAAGPTGIVAAAGELVNVATGSRMWSREKITELPMASSTKVMTAMVVLSHGDLNRKITVTRAAVRSHFANFDGLRWPMAYPNCSTPRDLIKPAPPVLLEEHQPAGCSTGDSPTPSELREMRPTPSSQPRDRMSSEYTRLGGP